MLCWVLLLCNLAMAQDKTPILTENFDENSNGWAETSFEEGEFAIKEGFYEFEHKRDRGAWTNTITVEIPMDKNYEIVTSIKTIKSLDTRNFGLVWGKDDDGNQYEFTINRNGEYSIEKEESLLDNVENDVWKGFIQQNIRYKNEPLNHTRLRYSFEEYCKTNGQKFIKKVKPQAKEIDHQLDDTSWANNLDDVL